MPETPTRSRILTICRATVAGGVLLAGSAALAQQPAKASQSASPGATPPAATQAVPAAKSATPTEEPQATTSASETPPADASLNGVIYQPARASAPKRVLASDDGDGEERARLAEEGRTLMADPTVQDLIQMRLQGIVITPGTPGLSEAQRTALGALMDYSSRAGQFVRPLPPPPPPPLGVPLP